MKAFVLVAILLTIAPLSVAEDEAWHVVPAPKGSGAKWFAEVKTHAGHKLILRRKIARAGYEVFAELHLPKGEKFADRMPKVQVDTMAVDDTAFIKLAGDNLNMRWGFIENNVATWRVWQSPRTELTADDALAPWREGTRLKIHYSTHDKRKRNAEFTLSGSSQAIEDVVSGPFQ